MYLWYFCLKAENESNDGTLVNGNDEDGEKTVISETPQSEQQEEEVKEGNAAEKVLEILLMFLESEVLNVLIAVFVL